MYKIVGADGAQLGYTEKPTYIRKSKNGCYVMCGEPDATGIAHNGTPYHLFGREALDELDDVMLTLTDGGAVSADVETLLGQIGGQAAEQMRRAIQLYAGTLSDEQAVEIATIYPTWEIGHAYAVNDIVSYGVNEVNDPQLYRVVQAHTSQADWTPNATPALYDAFGLNEQGYPVWSQPTGAHDAYNVGDIVDYNGTLYQSTIDGNVWAPDAYPQGWQVYEEVM